MQIEIQDISFSYNCVKVLNNVSFFIRKNQFVSILGPNGSGKSTLLKCINRILVIKQGEIYIKNRNIDSYKPRNLAKIVSYVSQQINSKNNSTVYEILETGRCPYINWKLKNSDREVIEKVVEELSLQPFIHKQFNQLSGGEQQKVKIARALVQEPEILLLDEPTNNLDLRHQVEVLMFISDIIQRHQITAIMAIHDLNLAARFTSSVILLKKGEIFSAGSPTDVINKENVRDVYGLDVDILKHKNSILVAI